MSGIYYVLCGCVIAAFLAVRIDRAGGQKEDNPFLACVAYAVLLAAAVLVLYVGIQVFLG